MLADDYIGEKPGGVLTVDEMKALMTAANEMTDQLHTLCRRIPELSQKHKFEEAGQAVIDALWLEAQYYGISAGTRPRLTSLITVLYAVIGIPYFEEKNTSLALHEAPANIDSHLSNSEHIDYMQQLFQYFEKYFSGESKPKQRRMEDVAEYINKKYSDPMLCAAMICDHFEINRCPRLQAL